MLYLGKQKYCARKLAARLGNPHNKEIHTKYLSGSSPVTNFFSIIMSVWIKFVRNECG